MRKLNVKLFLVLVAAATVAAGGVWALHTFQYQRIAAALLWQARHAEQDQKFDQTARYLQRYLEFAPHDVEQAAHLGATLAGDHFAGSTAARRQAYYVLNKVVNDRPDRLDLRRLLVKTALEIGEWSTARSTLEALAKNPEAGAPGSPERGELEGDWGRLLAAEKKPDEAVVHSRLAVKEAPDDVDSYVRLAWLLRAKRDVPAKEREKIVAEADQTIDDLVANNPTSAKAHLARWRYRREFGLLDPRGDDPKRIPVDKAAAEDVDAALSQAPEDVDALVAKADAEVLLRRPDQAYDSLHQGLKLQETKGYRAASDMGEFELLWHLATLLLSDQKLSENADKVAEVEQTIARIRKTRGQPAAADYLQARLLIHRKEWAKAAALLERTRPALAAQQAHADLIGQIDLCLGQCDLALEEPAQAERSFRLALEWDPDRAEAHLGLGEALRVLGRVDEALEHFRKAAEGAQDAGKGWLEVARLEIMRQLQQDDARRDWTKAYEAIDRAAGEIPAASPEGADPALLRGEVLAAQGRWDDAEKLLTDARNAHPDRVEFWTALANFAGRRDPDQKRALKILDEADAALHDRVDLRIARALRLAADPKPDLAALDAVVKKDRGGLHGEALEKLLGGLAEAEARAGQTDEAGRLLEELAKAPGRSNDLHLRLTLFDMAVRRHDADAMETALKAIREVEGGEGAFYGLGQALRSIALARSGTPGRAAALDDAWRALDRAAALRPNWSAVELARADVDDLSDDPEGAIKHLEEAVRIEQGRVGPEVVQRLVEGLYGRGRYAEAAGYVAVLRQSLLVDSPLGRLAAGVALNAGDVGRAKGLIEKAVRPESKNFRDLLLRARVHEAMNQPKDAEADYRRATEEAPEEPAAWVAYVGFLGNHGSETVAQTLIKSDVAVKVAKGKADLTEAQCYEALAMMKEANDHYDAAVKAAPDDPAAARAAAGFKLRFGRLFEAKKLLERLSKGEPKASTADVDWARRALATVLASSTNYNDFREALRLVGLGLDDAGMLPQEPQSGREMSVDLRRARARVLATQPQRQFRGEAIRLMEGLQPPDPDDLFILSVLYEADGNEAKEAEILKGLAAIDDRRIKPGYLSMYAQLLIRQGKSDRARLNEAERLVERVERLETERQVSKGAFGTTELRARLLEARGEGDKAVDLLRTYANRWDARPDEVLLLAASLGRQKRFAEAFDLCDKEDLFKKCPAAVGGVCEALLRAMPDADGRQRDRVERRLVQAVKDNPKLVVLKMHLADLSDLRGDYSKAEDLYRGILKDEPGNVVALNNLAWLLAQKTGEGAEALQCVEAAVNGIGRRADLLDTRGTVRLSLGQNAAALTDFADAVGDAPTGARLFHLARAQLLAGDRDAAIKTLRRAKADFGLQPSSVHPTEQQVCQMLMTELKVR